uniref:Uncharacterized protein n=1 Tax=Arundo donax TaxID=35708 RepID=A0A0A9G8S2_ARUDO
MSSFCQSTQNQDGPIPAQVCKVIT